MKLNDVASAATIFAAIATVAVPLALRYLDKKDGITLSPRQPQPAPVPAEVVTAEDSANPEARQLASYIRKERATGWTHIVAGISLFILMSALLGRLPPLFHTLLFGGLTAWGIVRLANLKRIDQQ